jgi:hypothetical protein
MVLAGRPGRPTKGMGLQLFEEEFCALKSWE